MLSHHRRQLHLNWKCNSLEVPGVDCVCTEAHIQTEEYKMYYRALFAPI